MIFKWTASASASLFESAIWNDEPVSRKSRMVIVMMITMMKMMMTMVMTMKASITTKDYTQSHQKGMYLIDALALLC